MLTETDPDGVAHCQDDSSSKGRMMGTTAIAEIVPEKATLDRVREDWRILHRGDLAYPDGIRLLSDQQVTPSEAAQVEHVSPGRIASFFRRFRPLYFFLHAWRLLRSAGSNCVVITNGGTPIWFFAGLMNRFLIRKRRILCWGIFLETNSRWKKALLRAALRGIDLAAIWSGKQVATHAKFLNLPESKFIFVPYKSNHSKQVSSEIPIGNYVFAGGNGKRDYRCLIEAVRGTDIPVVISATDPQVRESIERLPNVIALAAWEPAFSQLQAGCRFAVIPMISTGIKGGGEANFCNVMWHSRPVVAADDMAAHEYIEEGVTGYVVPSGDAQALRRRMLELWNDQDKTREMGRRAREHVETRFTHGLFIERLLRLALLLGRARQQPATTKNGQNR